jgi:hypothetical protein
MNQMDLIYTIWWKLVLDLIKIEVITFQLKEVLLRIKKKKELITMICIK